MIMAARKRSTNMQPADIEAVRRLHGAGHTIEEIAVITGYSWSAVYAHIRHPEPVCGDVPSLVTCQPGCGCKLCLGRQAIAESFYWGPPPQNL